MNGVMAPLPGPSSSTRLFGFNPSVMRRAKDGETRSNRTNSGGVLNKLREPRKHGRQHTGVLS
jgi:hypothetical protein